MRPLLTSLALGGLIALAALAAGALTTGGAVGATFIGMGAALAGPSFIASLLSFFVLSQALTRWRYGAKWARTHDIVEKGGPRDLWQVAANGGAFAVAAFLFAAYPSPAWAAASIGAIAAAAADTWGTEIGTAVGGTPRSVRTFRPVPVGTSGAVTVAGSVATLAGALVVGTAAALTGVHPGVATASVIGGVTGALVDTILGATIQDVRWCERCGADTERRVHRCGTVTLHRRGWRWVTNDVVNLTSTAAAACAAGGLWPHLS